MKLWFPIVLIALTAVSTKPANGLTNEDFVHYEDQAFRFSAWFPKTWKKVPTSHSETRLKVVSNAGHGVDDFSIVAMYFDNLQHTATDDIDKMTLGPKEYLRNLKTSAPDANLVESGSTHLSNQPARFLHHGIYSKKYGC